MDAKADGSDPVQEAQEVAAAVAELLSNPDYVSKVAGISAEQAEAFAKTPGAAEEWLKSEGFDLPDYLVLGVRSPEESFHLGKFKICVPGGVFCYCHGPGETC